jgi:mono/diheme cytochrome c family protein
MVMLRRLRGALAMLMIISPLAAAAEPQSVAFSSRGKPVGRWSQVELETLAPPAAVTVWEPHENRTVTYEGFDLTKLFGAVYGEVWKEMEEVVFTCADGYQPSLPVDRFVRNTAYLVYRRLDQPQFTIDNRYQNERDVTLAPFYLVWDNMNSRELREEGASAWPYRVVAVDLVTFAERFPNMSPPGDATPEEKQGFLAFRQSCMACHTINGDGGDKAPELNYPANVTEYLSDAWIRRWILDPRSIRYDATMPDFASHPDPGSLVANVLAYLKAMARNKRAPAGAGAQ